MNPFLAQFINSLLESVWGFPSRHKIAFIIIILSVNQHNTLFWKPHKEGHFSRTVNWDWSPINNLFTTPVTVAVWMPVSLGFACWGHLPSPREGPPPAGTRQRAGLVVISVLLQTPYVHQRP